MTRSKYKSELDHLSFLVKRKKEKEIKSYLEGLPTNIKGDVLECLLESLFLHNGWTVKITGGKGDAGADLLLYHNNLKTPDYIVQAKNWNKPLDENHVISELGSFEKKGSSKYQCSQYQLFSINGYSKSALKFSEYNIKLCDWSSVVNLINNYQDQVPEIPPLDLFSHNQNGFDNVQKLYELDNRVCIIQATGTGKSYISASVLQINQKKDAIFVAPTNVILNDFKNKFHYLIRHTRLMTYAKIAKINNDLLKEIRDNTKK